MRMLEFIQKIWDINIEYQKANWRLLMEFPLEIIGTLVTIISFTDWKPLNSFRGGKSALVC